MFERIGERIAKMVSIPTVSGEGNEEQYHISEYRSYLEKEFACLFENAEVYPIGEARLLRLPGTGEGQKAPVLFTGHMDVVPADAAAWKQPPFSGINIDGCVWGRGAQDMKGPQCALLSAIDALLLEGWRPDREIWLYLSCDEEIGGETTQKAAAWLKERGLHFETVFDEGGTICEDFMGLIKGRAALFGIAEKGSLEYRFTSESSGGHTANPPANSAIVRLAGLIQEIEHAKPFRQGLGNGNQAMLLAIAEHEEGERREQLLAAAKEEAPYPVLHSLTQEADTLLGATIAFTIIEGGTAFNVMPKKAVLTANVRVPQIESEKEITEKLQKIAEKYAVRCELIGGREAVPESAMDGSGYLAMKASVAETYPGLPVVPFVLGGGTDSRYFFELTDNILRFSPMHAFPEQGRGVHGENESVDVTDVEDAAKCYYTLLKNYL